MARGGIGLTVGHDKFLSDADLGDIAGGSQGASHHSVSVFYLDWVCGGRPLLSVSSVELGRMTDGRVQKSREGSIMLSPEQRLRQDKYQSPAGRSQGHTMLTLSFCISPLS